jgi:hypothetical protein
MTVITRPFQWGGGLVHTDQRDEQDRRAILFAQDQPGASVGRISTAQSITTASFTDITHDTEFFDNAGMWGSPANLTRVTVAYDGYYWCAAGAKWASQAGGVRVCGISVNGVVVDELSHELDATAIAGNFRHGTSGALALVTGDIVRVNVWQNGAATLNCTARLHVVRISGPGS